jgi:phosphinothricin acetyltransferase
VTDLREVEPADAAGVLAIYGPVVRDTAISFEVEVPSIEEMRRRIAETTTRMPWLAAMAGDDLIGYAYAGPHRTRAAYQWSVDVSVYVHSGRQRAGVGRALYTALLDLLALQGYCRAYAGITLPNPSSVGLHEAMGFRPVGIYRGVGFKLGAWHDVGWWQRPLGTPPVHPTPPRPLAEIHDHPAWPAALTAARSHLRAASRPEQD